MRTHEMTTTIRFTNTPLSSQPSLSFALCVNDCYAAGKQCYGANHFVLAHLIPPETRKVIKKKQYLNNEP